MPEYVRLLIKIAAYFIGVIMLLNITYADGRTFSLGYSNIIILVLANMAIFGSLIYTFTINKPWIRIGILPFIMAVFLGKENPEISVYRNSRYDCRRVSVRMAAEQTDNAIYSFQQ